MISSMFDYDQLKQSETFGIKKYKDSIYRGNIVNGQRSGLGVILYRTQRLYEG
jgi:hypothetical protein